ncbi:hypothetical protein N7481_000185 [Penicillium waksmanii]|uniref:uncharacterized protein n=1 Tax=Penicillium waksmanii TaxID=69791 RepID=UPI00254788F1|nr:uncharacterized protein N7481_000185 [Penicillium waksmanii]KAJ5999776.1 hypothetical protein N7481_000185 [Penicillium waksmanii]
MVRNSIIRRILSSEDEYSDLYDLLLRLSLCDESLPSLAVRHSITSLSTLHTHGLAAARITQGKAICAIRHTIASGLNRPNAILQVIAASLLMLLHEIYSREPSPTAWTGFLCGSEQLAKLIYEYDETYEGDFALILDWLFYHHVMYKFTIRHWARRKEEQFKLAEEPAMISKAMFSPMRNIVHFPPYENNKSIADYVQILPTLGCSLELLDLLTSVIDVIIDKRDPEYLSEKHRQAIRALDNRLCTIRQTERIRLSHPPSDGQSNENHERDTANLFRLAIRVYLERVGNRCRSSTNPEKLNELAGQAFRLISALGRVNQRFPIFVVALEARTDEQRALILRALANTEERRVPNELSSIRAMVQSAWVKMDLSLDSNLGLDSLGLYNDVIGWNVVPPAFT